MLSIVTTAEAAFGEKVRKAIISSSFESTNHRLPFFIMSPSFAPALVEAPISKDM